MICNVRYIHIYIYINHEIGKKDSHVVGQLLEMALLLGELLLQLEQLLPLAPADGVVLVGLLAPLEGVTAWRGDVSSFSLSLFLLGTPDRERREKGRKGGGRGREKGGGRGRRGRQEEGISLGLVLLRPAPGPRGAS